MVKRLRKGKPSYVKTTEGQAEVEEKFMKAKIKIINNADEEVKESDGLL